MAASNRCLRIRARLLRTFDQLRVSTVHTSLASSLAFTRNSHLAWVNQTISAFGNDVRSPLTAGNACTISPSEPRRTSNNLGSVMQRLTHSPQQFAGGMIFRITNNRHANP